MTEMQAHKGHRFGLVAARIGSEHIVRGADGVNNQRRVMDLRLITRPKDLKIVCLHAGCRGRSWNTEAEIVAGHAPHAVMVRQQEAHTWCGYSEEKVSELVGEIRELRPEEVKPGAPPYTKNFRQLDVPIGLCSESEFGG